MRTPRTNDERGSSASYPHRAFALVELMVAVVTLVVLAALVALSTDRARRLGRMGDDMAKFRRFGAATWAYAADNHDRFWSFSWKGGVFYPRACSPDLTYGLGLQAQANQAVCILRSRAGRTDIFLISGWIPHIYYDHLVLSEYLDAALPNFDAISASDERRLLWARDPHGFDAGLYQPAPSSPAPGTNSGKRWPYSASFIVPPAFFDESPVGSRISQAATHALCVVPGAAQLRGINVAKVAFPSQKVLMHDQVARHFPPRASYFAYAESRLPLLFVDGSVSVRATEDANPGWVPNAPTGFNPTTFYYEPQAWEAPTLNGLPSELVIGHYRWTRGGIEGRDFGGPEINTGQCCN